MDIIEKVGGTTKAAKICGVSPASVSGWRTNGVPDNRRRILNYWLKMKRIHELVEELQSELQIIRSEAQKASPSWERAGRHVERAARIAWEIHRLEQKKN